MHHKYHEQSRRTSNLISLTLEDVLELFQMVPNDKIASKSFDICLVSWIFKLQSLLEEFAIIEAPDPAIILG